MKRPIPEGVKPPEGCVILGWGGEFLVPDGIAFRGYFFTEEGKWFYCDLTSGVVEFYLYAADAGSEVARLNACPDPNCTDGTTFVTDLEGQPKQIHCGCEEDPRDGAIRGLVQKWRTNAKLCSDRGRGMAFEMCADELEAALKET